MAETDDKTVQTTGEEELVPTIDFDFSDVEDQVIADLGLDDEQNTDGDDDTPKPNNNETDDDRIIPDDKGESGNVDVSAEDGDGDKPEWKPEDIAAAKSAYDIYVDNGMLPKLSDDELKDKTIDPEFVHEQMVKAAQDRAQAFLDEGVKRLPEWGTRLLRYAYAKGQNVTEEEVSELFNLVKPTVYQESDFDDDEKAKEYLKAYHAERGYPESTTTEIIESLESGGKLKEQAKSFWEKDESQRQKQADKIVETAEDQRKSLIENREKFNNEFATALQSTKWRQDKQKQIVQEFYGGHFKQKIDNIMSNPDALIQLVDVLSYYKDGKFDMETYKKEALSPTTAKVKDKMGNYFKSQDLNKSGRQGQDEPEEFLGFAD